YRKPCAAFPAGGRCARGRACAMDVRSPASDAVAPFGLAAAAALLAGCWARLYLPASPSLWLLLPALAGGLGLWACARRLRLAGVFACAFALAGLHATWVLASRLPPSLEGTDVVVTGTVVELPRSEPGRLRFRLRADDRPEVPAPLRGR